MDFDEWWNSVNHTPAITKAEYGSDTPEEDVCRLAWNAALELGAQKTPTNKQSAQSAYNHGYAASIGSIKSCKTCGAVYADKAHL